LEALEDQEVGLVGMHRGQEAVLDPATVMVAQGEAAADSPGQMGEQLVIAEGVPGQIEVDNLQSFAAEQQAQNPIEHGLSLREM
jgi:hypothetical protein